ncbi:hypothetical protein GLV89_13600 [Halomonas alkaliantarctica]|nr:hypothetical protein [Halomonas alkaliantarctica]
MSKLLLHIGTGKTGSSSLQQALYFAHKEQRLGSISYPRLLGKRHHNELCTLVMPHERIRRDIRSRFPHNDIGYRDYQAQLDAAFTEQVTSANNIILSGEYFCGFNRTEAQRFAQRLERLGVTEVQVVVYFREPSELYLSQIQQRLKASSRFQLPQNFQYDYVGIATMWQSLFPNTVIREFSPPTLQGGSVTDDFMHLANRWFNTDLSLPQRGKKAANTSLTAASMKLLQTFRRQCYGSERDNVFDARTVKLLELLPAVEASLELKEKPRLRSDVKHHIRCHHQEQNRILARLSAIEWEAPDTQPPPLTEDLTAVEDVLDMKQADHAAYEKMLMALLHHLLNKEEPHVTSQR